MKYALESPKKYRIVTHSKYEQKSNSIIISKLQKKAHKL